MTMDQRAFFQELKSGTVHNVYLFYGQEALIRKSALEQLKKQVLMPGLEGLDSTVMQNPGAQQLIESCETLPMMSPYRLIIAEDCALMMSGKVKNEEQDSAMLVEYLARVPKSTCLVFYMNGAIDKRKKLTAAMMKQPGVVSFDALGDEELWRWMNQTLRRSGKRMEQSACEQLAFLSGRDLSLLSGELNKLVAYAQEHEVITCADVEQIATRTAESTVFAMAEAISNRRAQEAFSLLNVLLGSGEQRIGILAMITRHYRQMMQLVAMREARVPQPQQAKMLGVAPFVLNKIARQVSGRTLESLKRDVDACVRTDYDIKRGAMREDAALDRLILLLLAK